MLNPDIYGHKDILNYSVIYIISSNVLFKNYEMIICISFLKHLKDVTEWRFLPYSLVCPAPPSMYHWNVLIGALSSKRGGYSFLFLSRVVYVLPLSKCASGKWGRAALAMGQQASCSETTVQCILNTMGSKPDRHWTLVLSAQVC